MKTQVETFFIEETIDLIYDNEKLDQWNKLRKSLNLKGQSQVVHKDKSPNPFLYMNSRLKNIFQELCPTKEPINDFDIMPIPLGILELIALSEKEKYFSRIEIWYDEKDKDPCAVGIVEKWIIHKKGTYTELFDKSFTSEQECKSWIKDNNKRNAEPFHYSSVDKYYLIGRWCDVKESIEELKEKAISRYIKRETTIYKKEIKEYQTKLDNVTSEAISLFE